jgi:F-type H+-transporting ATPase subunit b
MSVFGVAYWLMGKIGQPTAEFLDNRAQNMLDLMNTKKNLTIAKLEKDIETEKKVEGVLSCRDEVFDIIRDEAEMQREELYRSRLDDVRTEVKRRLDYQLQLEGLEKTFQQRHLVSWLEDSVRESVTTKPDDSIPQCISSLKKMAATSS